MTSGLRFLAGLVTSSVFALGYAQPVTVAAAGDVACSPTSAVAADRCQMAATADLIARENVTAVLALGDLQYPQGNSDDFAKAYNESWGHFKRITYPVPGNHEYYLYDAQGYFRYFGEAARGAQGYYSFDLGDWHLIALNSNCLSVGGCDEASAQVAWLKRDLQAHPSRCTLAYWHHPRFSSGTHGSNSSYEVFWEVLADAHVDIVLSAHDHLYERFSPQSAEGAPDPEGIREFVVGTGGKSFYEVKKRQPNSEAVGVQTFGVLLLELAPTSYSWSFKAVTRGTFTDQGTDQCR